MRYLAIFVLMLVSCTGCGQRLPVARASGIVTLDGQPLVGASVTTQPIATDSRNPGPGSFGRTDAAGRFELELVKPAMKGAIIGEHRVMITPASDEGFAEAQQTADGKKFWADTPRENAEPASAEWPPSFGDGSLRMTITAEGTKDWPFDLKK